MPVVVPRRRMESRVTAMATPSRSTIRPTIWAPNSELPRASGIRDESATGCPPLASAGVPAAGEGVADGLICGNRLEASPPGMVVETPATAGSGPTGMLDPSPREPDRPEMVAVDPLPTPPGELVEPPPPPPADGDLDAGGLELGDLVGALVTVIVGAVAVLAAVPLLFLTERVALYPIVSPAGAFFGTLTCTSNCGPPDGCLAGTVSRLQVVPEMLLHVSTVYFGAANAGVFALWVRAVVIVPLVSAAFV